MSYVEFNGKPGTTWKNEGSKVRYQLIVAWTNSCGVCIQYDHAIGPSWPIPFHHNCRCHQLAIFPNGESDPFVDYRKKILDLDHSQRAKVCGVANLHLVESGVVKWSDVVTEGRVRDFREVVSLKRLDAKTLKAAGIPKAQIDHAMASVNTPAHQLAEAARKRIIDALRAKGLSDAEINRITSQRLAGRVNVVRTPPGPGGAPPAGPPNPPPPAPMPAPKIEPAIGKRLTPKAKAAIREGATPSGTAVSNAIEPPKGRLGSVVNSTLKSIDELHGDGALDRIPVIEGSLGKNQLGAFRWRAIGRSDHSVPISPIDIGIAPGKKGQSFTLAHEIGHFLDKFGVPEGSHPAANQRDRSKDPRFKAWHAAITASETYSKLLTEKASARAKPKTTFIDYLLDPQELWARSYSQWVALRSESETLKVELEEARRIDVRTQWTEVEFESIAKTIDDLFLLFGWRVPK